MEQENPIIIPAFDFGDDFSVIYEPPTAEQYLDFRKLTGLGDKEPSAVRESLSASVFAIQILHKGECIGFCRLLSDGGHWFFMADGVILPEFQAAGIGKFMVTSVTHAFFELAPPGAYLYAVTHAPKFGVKSGLNYTPENVEGFYSWIPMNIADVDSVKPEVDPVKLADASKFEASKELPSEEEYHELRAKLGLIEKDGKTTSVSFKNTKFAISVRRDGELIGFSRILGDHGVWFYFGDVLVDPRFKDRDLEAFMLYALNEDFYYSRLPGAYLLLYTTKSSEAFKAGFIKLPEREVPLYHEKPYPSDKGEAS